MKSFTTKIFFALFVLVLSVTGIYGQSPVTASVSLSDPSPYLEDYMQPGRLLATLVSTDQRPTYAVRLQFSIEAGGQRILLPGDPTFAPVVELTRGLPLVLQGEDLRPYFDLNFLDPPTRERILALGNELPAGPVTICLAAFDLNFLASPPVSNTACGMGIIDLHQPPLLVAPTSVSSSADVNTSTPQAINFSWQPQHFFAAEYRLEIWADELGFGDNFLIENVPPLVQINTLNTSYLLTDINPILEAGFNYVWRVQASDLADRERFINDGFSELGRFRMVAPEPDLPPVPCGMPGHLTYQLIDEQTVSLSWTPANDLPHTLDLGSMDDPAYLSSSIGASAGTIGSEAPFGSSGQEESSTPDLPTSSTGSYTWTGLEAGYEYYVYVCAPCPGSSGTECRFLSFEMPNLASCAPNILAQMGEITPTSVQFSWTSDPAWTDHYSIHIGMDSMYLPPTSQETTCGSLNPDTDYVARICAHCPAGAGQNCVEYSFRTTDFRCATTAEIEELLRITTLPPDGIRIDWSELPAEVLEQGPDIAISPEYEGPEIADRPAESGQNQDFTGLEAGQTYTITFCLPCGEEQLCVTRDITIPLCEELVVESFDSRYVFHDRAEVFWGLPQVATIDSFRLGLRTETSSVWLAQSPGIIGQMEAFRFDQLTPNTTYVAELCPICDGEATNCEELIFTTTAVVCDQLGDDSEFEYICGDESDLLPFDNVPVLQQLRPGDSIWVADFKMEILEVSSLSPPWAGRGRTAVPYLNGALVEFTFSAIEINENCRLTAGELEAVPPWAELVTDLQNTLYDAQDLLSNLTSTIDDLSTALGLVEDVADMLATLQELQMLMQQDPENFPPELQDQLQEAIDCLTDPDIVDKSVCEELIEDVIAGLEELQSALYDADYQVDFLPAEEMIYGYDTLSYPEMNIRDWYIQVPDIDERPYAVAWKSVPQGQSDYVLARRDPAGSLDSVRFVYQDLDSEVGNPTPLGDDRVLEVDFASSPTVYARQVRPSDGGSSTDGLGGGSGPEVESLIAGQLALVEYPEKELNVVLVPLNGASASFDLNDPALADELQRIYRPAIVETSLSVYPTPFQVDGVDVIPDQASGVRSYPQPLRRIIEAFEDQNPDLDEDTYYLFVCQTFAGDEAGFMPRKRQFGFLYLNNAPTEPTAFARLIGHELGHGAYHLQHPWQETTLPESATDNLMDYTGGGRLHKWQWDLIDDPVAVAGLFEGDGDGSGESEVLANDLFNQMIQAVGLYGIAYCEICEDDNCANLFPVIHQGRCLKCIFYRQVLEEDGSISFLEEVPRLEIFTSDEFDNQFVRPRNDNLSNLTVPIFDIANFANMMQAGRDNLTLSYRQDFGSSDISMQCCLKDDNPIVDQFCSLSAEDTQNLIPEYTLIETVLNSDEQCVADCGEEEIAFPFIDADNPVAFVFQDDEIPSNAGLSQALSDLQEFIVLNGYGTELVYQEELDGDVIFFSADQGINYTSYPTPEDLPLSNNFRIEISSYFVSDGSYPEVSITFRIPEDFVEVHLPPDGIPYTGGTPGSVYSRSTARQQINQLLHEVSQNISSPLDNIYEQNTLGGESQYDGNHNTKEGNFFKWATFTVSEISTVISTGEIGEGLWNPENQKYQHKLANIGCPTAGIADGGLVAYRDMKDMVELVGAIAKDPVGVATGLYEGVRNFSFQEATTQIFEQIQQDASTIANEPFRGRYLMSRYSVQGVFAMVFVLRNGAKLTLDLSEAVSGLTKKIRNVGNALQEVSDDLLTAFTELGDYAAEFAVDFENITDFSNWNAGMVRAWEVLYPSPYRLDIDVLDYYSIPQSRFARQTVVDNGLAANYPNLEIEEVAAIYHYSDEGFESLNAALRSGNISASDRGFQKLVDEGLGKLPDYSGGKISRGVYNDEAALARTWSEGDDISFSDFKSFSKQDAVAEDFMLANGGDVIYEVHNPVRGKDIANLSAYSPEAEVLFTSGGNFRVGPISNVDGIDYAGNIVSVRKITLIPQ